MYWDEYFPYKSNIIMRSTVTARGNKPFFTKSGLILYFEIIWSFKIYWCLIINKFSSDVFNIILIYSFNIRYIQIIFREVFSIISHLIIYVTRQRHV